jgi:hypothetical protein
MMKMEVWNWRREKVLRADMETFEDAQSSENIRGEDPIAGRHSQCICTMMWNLRR